MLFLLPPIICFFKLPFAAAFRKPSSRPGHAEEPCLTFTHRPEALPLPIRASTLLVFAFHKVKTTTTAGLASAAVPTETRGDFRLCILPASPHPHPLSEITASSPTPCPAGSLCTHKPISVPRSRFPASACQGMGPPHIPPTHHSAVSAAGYALLQASLSLPRPKGLRVPPPPAPHCFASFLSFLTGTEHAVRQAGLARLFLAVTGPGPRPRSIPGDVGSALKTESPQQSRGCKWHQAA